MKQKNSTVMAEADIKWLRDFSESKGGVAHAAALLGLSREALTRAIAGLGVHRGTAALLTQGVAQRRGQ